ncbi:hypothetical protein BH09MYX1_BH09MYX1_31880 [soil metagenome]
MRSAFAGFVLLSVGCGLDQAGLLPIGSEAGVGVDATIDATGAVDAASADVIAADGTTEIPDANGSPDTGQPLDSGLPVVDAAPDAGPLVTITGGTYALDPNDAGICSMNGADNTFKLLNQHGAAVELIWVDYQCMEMNYGTVAINGMKTQGTFVNHVWRIRNDSDKAFLAQFRLTGAGPYTVTVH